MRCPNCKSNNVSLVETYKHQWINCNDCNIVSRERKGKYIFDKLFFRLIINNSPLKLVYGKTLLAEQDVIKNEKHFYDYYYDIAKKGSKGTKWENFDIDVISNLKKHNINIENKKILDVSGGPGFLTKTLSNIAQKAIVTEFSQHAVNGMKEALQIEAVKFDYNNDNIYECLNEKFDIILIIYSIGFCNDLKKFVHSLKKIMTEHSVVYICYSPPTLGLMIRWQFEEYTYNRCWTENFVNECFNEIGMSEFVKEEETPTYFDTNWYNTSKNIIVKLFQSIHRIVGKYYLKKYLKQNKLKDHNLTQRGIRQIFKFKTL